MGILSELEISAFARAMIDRYGDGALRAALIQASRASNMENGASKTWCAVASEIFYTFNGVEDGSIN